MTTAAVVPRDHTHPSGSPHTVMLSHPPQPQHSPESSLLHQKLRGGTSELLSHVTVTTTSPTHRGQVVPALSKCWVMQDQPGREVPGRDSWEGGKLDVGKEGGRVRM